MVRSLKLNAKQFAIGGIKSTLYRPLTLRREMVPRRFVSAMGSNGVPLYKAGVYRASKLDGDVCPLKPQCPPKEPSRKIPRDMHERARDVARSFAGTEGFEWSRRERKKIEMRFAHLKRVLRHFDCAANEAPKMSLFLPPSLRTCGGSRRWLLGRHPPRFWASRNVGVASTASGPARQSRVS